MSGTSKVDNNMLELLTSISANMEKFMQQATKTIYGDAKAREKAIKACNALEKLIKHFRTDCLLKLHSSNENTEL